MADEQVKSARSVGKSISIMCASLAAALFTILVVLYLFGWFMKYMDQRKAADVVSRIPSDVYTHTKFSRDYVHWMAATCVDDKWRGYSEEQKREGCACFTAKRMVAFNPEEMAKAKEENWDPKKVPQSLAKNFRLYNQCRELVLQGNWTASLSSQ